MMDELSQWIDKHIRLVRLIPYCIGGLGIYLIVKHTYLFTQFRSVSQIPRDFIANNKKLLGRVKICYGDHLEVWHIPYGRHSTNWKTVPPSNSDDNLLRIKFSGVTINNQQLCHQYLSQHLTNQLIQFILLSQSWDNTIECIVYLHKQRSLFRRKVSINEQLVINGLASVDAVKGFHSNQHHVSFLTSLTRNELTAKNKGIGMWAGSGYEKQRWRILRTLTNLFKKR